MEGKCKGKKFTRLGEYEAFMRENLFQKYRILNNTFGRWPSETKELIETDTRRYLEEIKENDDSKQDPCCNKDLSTGRKGKREPLQENKEEVCHGESFQEKNPRYPKRVKGQVFYEEDDIPSDDDYIFCDLCHMEWEGDCPKHGGLTYIEDKELHPKHNVKLRAMLSVPDQLEVLPSGIKFAGLGVWAKQRIDERICFGPYLGVKRKVRSDSGYAWEIRHKRKISHFVDASNPQTSNWMRYVNCARHEEEQNLVAFQYKGQIYYRTVKVIKKGEELLVWYGDQYGKELGIDCKGFHQNRERCKTRNQKFAQKNNYGGRCPAMAPNMGKEERRTAKEKKYNIMSLNMYQDDSRDLSTGIDEHRKSQQNVDDQDGSYQRGHMETMQVERWLDNGRICVIKGRNGMSELRRVRIMKRDDEDSYINAKGEEDEEKKGKDGGEGSKEKAEDNVVNCKEDLEKRRDCGENIRSNAIEEGMNEYKLCHHCGEKKQAKDELIKHIYSVHLSLLKYEQIECNVDEEKRHKCTFCQKAFKQKCTLVRHLRIHTGEKPYKCKYCEYSTSDNSHLIKHIRTHTGEKPYKCKYCEYSCSQNSHLIKHIRTHTGEKPYKCKYCEYSTAVSSSLITHIRTHTGEKPFKCKYCEYSCSQNSSLIKHIRTHTGEKPFKCKYCEYSTAVSSSLITHIRKHKCKKP